MIKVIKAPARVLEAKWSIVDAEHDTYLNEISKEAVELIKEQIDWEILSSILIKEGWTHVKLSDDVVELEWIADNCKGGGTPSFVRT
jgi:hypothetical protein